MLHSRQGIAADLSPSAEGGSHVRSQDGTTDRVSRRQTSK